jgi:hypothetical protein
MPEVLIEIIRAKEYTISHSNFKREKNASLSKGKKYDTKNCIQNRNINTNIPMDISSLYLILAARFF